MSMLRNIAGLALMLAVVAAWNRPAAKSNLSRCVSAGAEMDDLVDNLRDLMADPGKGAVRDSLKLPTVASELVVPVYTDSLCDLAGRAINRNMQILESRPRLVFLVRIGSSRYWAEDHALEYGEWIESFIIDSTLSTVLVKTQH